MKPGEHGGDGPPAGGEPAWARLEWERRRGYRAQGPETREAARLLATGRVRCTDPEGIPGIDGAWYSPARFRVYSSSSYDPAVVVTTMTGFAEVVDDFASEAARDGWLAGRAPSGPGPLASTLDGPPCRTAREEALLAWLLRHGTHPGHAPGQLRPEAFTTWSRQEAYLAWRGSGPGKSMAQVEAVLERRLASAPDWAAPDIGAPGERTVPGYLRRLAATPVTEGQASAALRDLARADAQAVQAARHAAAPAPRPGAAPAAGTGSLLTPPPPPGPDGPGPCHRM